MAILATVLLVGAAPPAAFAAPTESISAYDVRISVGGDGRIRVVETIGYDFGPAHRHGIYRDIPVVLHYDATRDRRYRISDVTAGVDGEPAPFQRYLRDNYLVIKVGDAQRTVTGGHTYVVSYTVAGALNGFADHTELYWNAIGDEWRVPIAAATVTVSGPAPVGRVACYRGRSGSRSGCASASVSGATASFLQPDLGHGAGMSTVVAFPPASVGGTAPTLVPRRDAPAWFHPSVATVAGGSVLAVLGAFAAVLAAWLLGRDRRYVGQLPGLLPEPGEWAIQRRRPLRDVAPVSVEFTPPHSIRPGQAGALVDGRADLVDITATIVDFAVRRHLRIVELPPTRSRKRTDWRLVKLTDAAVHFRPYEHTLFRELFGWRRSVRLSELTGRFGEAARLARRQLDAELVHQGWYPTAPARTVARVRRIAVLLVLVALAATAALGYSLHAGIAGAGLAAGPVVLLCLARRFPCRTGKGSAVLARLDGFRLYLANAEAEQIRFQEREEIFAGYLPYAMVFGLTGRWAAVLARLGAAGPATGPTLSWYTGGPWYTDGWYIGDRADGDLTGSLNSFAAAAIAGMSASASASGHSGLSGGSSGGDGSSGGGGGGGGGGSW